MPGRGAGRSPRALAALGDKRLRATQQQLAAALTGRFREVHAFEIATHLRLTGAINAEITRLDARIGQQLTATRSFTTFKVRPAPSNWVAISL